MKKQKKVKIIKFTSRFPEDLVEMLDDEAVKNIRTRNAEIVNRLTNSLQENAA